LNYGIIFAENLARGTLVTSHNRPHFAFGILGLAVLWSALAVGCAAPQAYVPFQQPSALSIESRWLALENLAKNEKWKIVESDIGTSQITAYRYYETPGVRDRIKIVLLPDRTVVETGSEIEESDGRWSSSSIRCPKYDFVREKVMVAHIEYAASGSGHAAPEKAPDLTLPPSRSSRVCNTGIR
jgi:hypothetical protein